MSWSASLQVRNDVAELSRLGAWVEAWAMQHGVADETAQRIDLCATEMVTNVMTHGDCAAPARAIDLRVAAEGDNLVLDIVDDGVAFDPTLAPLSAPVTMDSDRVGGWGMRIVRNLSDEVRYRHAEGRNRLQLVFYPRAAA